MSPQPKTSALALAATLTSLVPSRADGQTTDPPDPPPPEALGDLRPEQVRPRQESQPRAETSAEKVEELPPIVRDRTIEPFVALGFNTSFITSDLGDYTFPRIAPVLGAGLRIKPDAKFSAQFELALDFLGGTYNYLYYLISWYTYAATYLSVPLLARHRLTRGQKESHFVWGLQFSQKIGESTHRNLLGIPIYVESGIRRGGYYSYYYGRYGGGSDDGFFTRRMLSLSVGYQSRKVSRRKVGTEFEMRFNAGVSRLGSQDTELVSSFSFRWNFVPGTGEQ